ncbi:NAD-dependent formate dehydrogenase [Azospirillum argentinense]
MAKVVCVLYDDPVTGYPTSYARDDLPKIEGYAGGQTLPTPKAIDFQPGTLLGSVSGELGLRRYLESLGHELVVTSDKDGPDSRLEQELADAEIVISQPFWPAYLTAERIAKAPKLKLALTAGIGSDHVDLQAAMNRGITVAEVTYCNSISVAEHVVMMILGLVRNYIPSHQWVLKGGWNIADCVARSYDLEGMHVGTVAAGRIGLAVLRRLKPFDMHLHYTDRHRLPESVERELGLTWHATREEMFEVCDVVTLHCLRHTSAGSGQGAPADRAPQQQPGQSAALGRRPDRRRVRALQHPGGGLGRRGAEPARLPGQARHQHLGWYRQPLGAGRGRKRPSRVCPEPVRADRHTAEPAYQPARPRHAGPAAKRHHPPGERHPALHAAAGRAGRQGHDRDGWGPAAGHEGDGGERARLQRPGAAGRILHAELGDAMTLRSGGTSVIGTTLLQRQLQPVGDGRAVS